MARIKMGRPNDNWRLCAVTVDVDRANLVDGDQTMYMPAQGLSALI